MGRWKHRRSTSLASSLTLIALIKGCPGHFLRGAISTMAVAVDFCNEDDFYRLFCIISDSFGEDQPYIDLIFPNHHEHAGRLQGAERLLQMKRNDPTNRFLKAIDTATGEIIGQAKWIVFADGKPEETPLTADVWETEDEKERAKYVYAAYLEPRRKAARTANGSLICWSCLRYWAYWVSS